MIGSITFRLHHEVNIVIIMPLNCMILVFAHKFHDSDGCVRRETSKLDAPPFSCVVIIKININNLWVLI